MEIRQKFRTGIGGILFILLLSCGTAIGVIRYSNRELETIYKNNYDSVVLMHQLVESLEKINSRHLAFLRGAGAPDRDWASEEEAKLEASLFEERQHVAEIGEGERLRELEAAWARYKADLLRFHGARGSRPAAKRLYDGKLEPQYQEIKALAWRISDLNLKGISRFRGRGGRLVGTTGRMIFLLLLAGILLSSFLILMLGRSVLKPIQQLMDSAREIEKGNLDLVLESRSEDELGQLARAFNAMTGRLREFRHRDRAKLLRIQKTTQLAINSFSDPVAVFSPTGQVELCNPAAEGLFGVKKGATLHGSGLAHLGAVVSQVMEKGEPFEPHGYGQVVQVFPGGIEKFLLPRLLPVLDEQRKVAGVTMVLVDVTGLRKMDEMKTDLLSTVSHELKTPLTSLRMAAHLLLEKGLGPLTPRQEDILLTAREASDRLHAILEDLLDLSRLEAGKSVLQLKEQDAAALVEGALPQLKQGLQDKGLSLELSLEPGLPAVLIDPQRISHVFSNLFGNAIKYSPEGGLVSIGAEAEPERVRFWVRDSGPGIPEAYKSRVFERFFRMPGHEDVQGAGLGLAIAKEIVEMHGGDIILESAQGRGSTFIFWLPRSRP